MNSDWLHLDMERESDLARVSDAEAYLERQAGRLVIIDEIQRKPELFRVLRSLINERIRAGEKAGHFLVLGSASRDLLRQSSETLAGRISYLELRPFVLPEVARASGPSQDRLWLRGGFPRSALAGNVGKRLVKSPKIYLRDSGLLHRLLSIPDLDALEGHPVIGRSWEGFVIENVLAQLPADWQASYFRSAAQAEIDLVLEGPRGQVVAIEVKRTLSPRVSRGFLNACEDIRATHRFYVIPSGEERPMGHDTEGLALPMFLSIFSSMLNEMD